MAVCTCAGIFFNFQFQITLLSPNIHFPQYTCTPKDYINTYINNSVNLSNVMGANGAGNPVGFMGSLSDTLNIIYHNRGARVQGVQQ